MMEISIPKWTYETGDEIIGKVIYTTKNTVKEIKSAKIMFKAYEVVFVKEKQRKYIIQEAISLFPTLESASMVKLTPNTTYQWPFKFKIPDTAPPSLQDPSGGAGILYKLKAVVIPKWGLNTIKREVIRVDKLDTLDHRPPRMYEASKSFSASDKSESNNLMMRAILDRRASHSGEEVKVDVNIKNNSTKPTNSIKAYLMRSTKYGNARKIYPVMFRKFNVKIPPSGNWSGEFKIRVPQFQMVPTIMNGQLIQVQYFISVRVHTSVITKDVVVDLPLQIAMATFKSPTVPGKNPPSVSKLISDIAKSPVVQRKLKEVKKMINSDNSDDEDQAEVGDEISLIDRHFDWEKDNTPCLIPEGLFSLPSAGNQFDQLSEDFSSEAKIQDWNEYTSLRSELAEFRSDFANPFFGSDDGLEVNVRMYYHALYKLINDISSEYQNKSYDLNSLRNFVENTKSFLNQIKSYADLHDQQREVERMGLEIIDEMLQLLEGLFSHWETDTVIGMSHRIQAKLENAIALLSK
eukprot:TRINITY_DN1883_c14_g1_i1.p1 TRINITY_DN1883_c14_g1~~TRINITY_DN1883_c14_g1_i1.p1  ORF type:complete len:520 (+),score=164.14 TRINITY_DN1883_c14_g1_i1:93-1652(+)